MKIQLACIALLAGSAANASPFTMTEGETKLNLIYTDTTGTELIRGNGAVDNLDGEAGAPPPSWSSKGFEISHKAYTLQALHGLSPSTDVKFSLTYKQIEKSGFWPSDPGKGGTFDNWSDFSVGVNHMFYNTDSVFT